MLQKITHSSADKIKDNYIKVFEEISIFFNQLKITKEEIDYALMLIREMKEKLLYIIDIYSITPEEFPNLPTIFSNNFIKFQQTFKYIEQQYNLVNLHSFYQYMIDYNATFTEQYLKIAIEGLYNGVVTKKLPLLPLVEAQEKLFFSIESLEDFFKRIITNSTLLADILFEIENIRSNLPIEISTYFIILTKLLSSIKNINLDYAGQVDVVKTMQLQIRVIKEKLFSKQEQSILYIDEMPALKKKMTELNSQVNIFDNELLDAKTTFSKSFLLCRDKTSNTSDKINQIDSCLNKMYVIYNRATADFSGLPGIFLKDANLLHDRCTHYISKKQDVLPELEKFNQQMLRRHFQLQISYLYNNIFCDNDPVSMDYDENWQVSFKSIESTLSRMYDKMETVKAKTKAKASIESFVTLKEILLVDESFLPTVKFARQCIIALDKVLKKSTDIWNLSFKMIEKMMDSIDEMRSKLAVYLENELTQDDENFDKKRMQVIETNTPSKDLSPLPTTIFLATENPIAHNLFTAKYSVPTFTTTFNFFSERKSTSELRRIAKSNGLTCVDVEGDGNCLFSAVALQLKQKREEYAKWQLSKLANKLREDANQYLKINQAYYEEFVTNENYDQFITRMEKTGQWADHLHIDALTKVLNVKIVVINSNDGPPNVLGPQNASEVICLGYEVDLHFQALVPLNKSNNLPPAIIEIIKNAENKNITTSSHKK